MADSLSSISGVSSGIDWKALVEQIITLDRRPAAKLEASIQTNAKRKDALEQFRTAMASLKTATDALKDGSAFDAFTAATSGADATGRNVASAVADAGASPGTYSVQVTQLAQSQKTVGSVPFASATTNLALSGRLVIGGQNVDLVNGDTLATVRDKINLVAGGSNVQATLLAANADGTGQRLVLTGTKTGAAAAFTPADDPANTTSLVAAFGLGGAPQVAAADALLRIDDAVDVARPTNSIGDAIPGVTLALSARGTSTITITRQDAAGATAVQSFVDAYNKLQTLVKQATESSTGPLAHDALLRGARSQLAQVMIADAGATAAADLSRLGTAGVALQKDGTLKFDSAAWKAVYPARVSDVKTLLADRMGAVSTFVDTFTTTATGAIDTREAALTAQSDAMQKRIDDTDARLDKKRSALLMQYSRSEALLGRLKSLSESLGSQITSLSSSSSS